MQICREHSSCDEEVDILHVEKSEGGGHLEKNSLSVLKSSFIFKSSSNWVEVLNCSLWILFNYVNQGIAEE